MTKRLLLSIQDSTHIQSINPLSPNIHKQILQTDLYTFPYRICWEKLIKDQRFFFLWSFDFLIDVALDILWVLLGENWCWLLLGLKGLKYYFTMFTWVSKWSSAKAPRLCKMKSPGTSFNRFSVRLRVMTPQLPVFCLPYTFLGAIQKFSNKYRKRWICFSVRANQE